MFSRKSVSAVIGALIVGFSMVVSGHSSETDLHTNYLTFSQPVGLPGVSLPAGTYIFERVERTNPDIVVVRSRDRSRVYFMALTQRVNRPFELPDHVAVAFSESPTGGPVSISAWYPIGESLGHRFLYKAR
jgi:hypothetical protein